MSTLADRVKAARVRAGLTQKTLAQAMGVSEMQVSRWERGVVPDPENLARLAKALGVTTDHLVGHDAESVETVVPLGADEIREWPPVRLLIAMMPGEEPTDDELLEVTKISVFYVGSDAAPERLAMGMRDTIRGMRTAMTEAQRERSRAATERHRDPSVKRRR